MIGDQLERAFDEVSSVSNRAERQQAPCHDEESEQMRKQMLVGDLRCEDTFLSRGHLLHVIVDSAQQVIGLTSRKHRRGRSFALARAERRHLIEELKLRFNLGAECLGVALRNCAVAGSLPYLIK